MAEYIEREALLLRIDCHGTNKFGMLDEDIRAFIKSQPAADVVPVVHGRWVTVDGISKCSKCEYIPAYDSAIDDLFYSPYCPQCGARMDGGADDEV